MSISENKSVKVDIINQSTSTEYVYSFKEKDKYSSHFEVHGLCKKMWSKALNKIAIFFI